LDYAPLRTVTRTATYAVPAVTHRYGLRTCSDSRFYARLPVCWLLHVGLRTVRTLHRIFCVLRVRVAPFYAVTRRAVRVGSRLRSRFTLRSTRFPAVGLHYGSPCRLRIPAMPPWFCSSAFHARLHGYVVVSLGFTRGYYVCTRSRSWLPLPLRYYRSVTRWILLRCTFGFSFYVTARFAVLRFAFTYLYTPTLRFGSLGYYLIYRYHVYVHTFVTFRSLRCLPRFDFVYV